MQHKAYVYFSTPDNLFWWPLSWIIRFIESKERPKLYHSSHAAIRIGDYIYEAVLFLGVRKISFEKWYHKNNISMRYSVVLSNQDLQNVHAFCEGSIGVPYATFELLGILYSRFMVRFFKRYVDNPFCLIKRKVKCTEFVYEAIKRIAKIRIKGDLNNLGVRDLEEAIVWRVPREVESAIP